MSSKKGGNTTHYTIDPIYELDEYERKTINYLLGRGKNYIVHNHDEKCTVVVPQNLKTMYERISNIDVYIRKLQREKQRLFDATCGLKEALEKRYSVETNDQFKAYKQAYDRTCELLKQFAFANDYYSTNANVQT